MLLGCWEWRIEFRCGAKVIELWGIVKKVGKPPIGGRTRVGPPVQGPKKLERWGGGGEYVPRQRSVAYHHDGSACVKLRDESANSLGDERISICSFSTRYRSTKHPVSGWSPALPSCSNARRQRCRAPSSSTTTAPPGFKSSSTHDQRLEHDSATDLHHLQTADNIKASSFDDVSPLE